MEQSGQQAGNMLVHAAPGDPLVETAIYDTLSHSPPTETNLLVISYQQGPDAWLANWQAHVGEFPAALGFLHVGGMTRAAVTSQPPSPMELRFGFIDTVSDPADLTRLGIQVNAYLEQWADTENQIIVYLDSLTALLEFVKLQRAFRFLHVLSGRIESVDGQAYYRLDPDAHEAQTIAIVHSLMDETLMVTERDVLE